MAKFNPELQGGEGEEATRKKYRKLAHQFHPDLGGSEDEMRELNEAYDQAKAGNFLQLDEMYEAKFGSEQQQADFETHQQEQDELFRQDQAEKDEAYRQHEQEVEENARKHAEEIEAYARQHEQEIEEAQREKAI